MIFKVNKDLILFLSIAVIFLSCSSEKKIESKIKKLDHIHEVDSRVMGIDFQQGFMNDTVSLKINDFDIFNNRILNTDTNYNFAGVRIYFYGLKNDKVAVSIATSNSESDSFDSIKFSKIDIDHVILKLNINNNLSEFSVDLTKGKYIGASKIPDNKSDFFQKHIDFAYD
ncbi:MAG TPA: hypothetical protein PLP23_10270 [Panacibacter sp.]|nr:hypothetical protein [Panacibacter sp.]